MKEKDTNFVPITAIDKDGNKMNGYLYKPQQLLCFGTFMTTSFAEFVGIKVMPYKKDGENCKLPSS